MTTPEVVRRGDDPLGNRFVGGPRPGNDPDCEGAAKPAVLIARAVWLQLGFVLASLGAVLVAPSAEAQFKGVQPIFNQQLGAWPASNQTRPIVNGPVGSGPGGGGHGPGGHGGGHHHHGSLPGYWIGGYFPWGWGGSGWGWGYPVPYPYAGPGYSFIPGYNWYGVAPPVVVVQPQIVQVPMQVPQLPANAVAANRPAAGNVQPPVGVGGGVAGNGAMLPPPRVIRPDANAPGAETEILRRVIALRKSDANDRTRADQAIADGDQEFADGQYRRAMLDYRDALKRAPDYPLALFRAGHAHTVLGDYDLAVTYFGMGLELSRDTVRDGFTLDTLYKGDAISKQQHYGELGAALRRQPQDGGLNYLMGMMLHYDGNAAKAEEYFRKAVDLPGRHRPYAAMYLPDEPPAAPVAAAEPMPAPPVQAPAVQAPLPQVPLQPAPALQAPALQAPAVQAPPAVPQAATPQEAKPAGAKPPVPRPVN